MPLKQIQSIFGFGLLVVFASCVSPQRNREPIPQTVFISEKRVHILRDRIVRRIEPNYSAWKELQRLCDENRGHTPNPIEHWAIPGYYENAELHEKLVDSAISDSNIAYQEALCYQITENEQYAAQAQKILRAWASTFKTSDASLTDTMLSASEIFSTMVAAADLLRNYSPWMSEGDAQFKNFLRQKILPLNTMNSKKNNWSNWGMLLVASIGSYLRDKDLLSQAESRFRYLIDIQIASDGTMPSEIDRSDTIDFHEGPTKGKKGIWYTNFALMPTTLTAEVLMLQERDVYQYQSQSGGSLKTAFFKAAGWCFDPTSFPYYKSNDGKLDGLRYVSYFEILNKLWPNAFAESVLAKNRPTTSEASFPNLTFTHGGLGPEYLLVTKDE